MRFRIITLMAASAFAIAACNPSSADETTTTAAEETTTTTTKAAAPDAARLSYTLEPGATHTYEVVIDQRIEMTAEGDPAALGEEGLPGEMAVNLTGTTTFSHSVAEGPEPGTYEVRIQGDFTDLEITGTMDGAPIDTTELPDFAGLDPIDVTVIVDEQGNIIPGEELGNLFGSSFGDLGDFGATEMDPGRFLGPPFPDGEITVGDSWTETIETPSFIGDETITTEVYSEVIDTDTVDGEDVFVITTEWTTSMIEFDLAELMIGFFQAFIPDDATEEQKAELEAIVEELRFLFVIDPTSSEMTTWFDATAGIARQADLSGAVHFVMDINMPDETTGEMVSFMMEMSLDQDISYRLIEHASA